MNAKGLELLKTRKTLERIEEIRMIGLPSMYESFLLCFELGKEGLDIDFVYDGLDIIQFSTIVYKTEICNEVYENSITNFLSFDELKLELKDFAETKEEYHKNGFIKIGNFDILDRILLKVIGDQSDEIWRFNGDWGQSKPFADKLSKNIFEFVQYLSKEIIQLNLSIRNIDQKDIRKGLDDKHWYLQSQIKF